MPNILQSITAGLLREAGRVLRRGPATQPSPGRAPRPGGRSSPAAPPLSAYPGDFRGRIEIRYAPHPDGEPDPGEVVWAWVPYEEDHTQGKDRPVLLVGRDGPWLLGLQLTSQDHDRDAEQERRAGRAWVDIGSGGWDKRGRASEVRVNRIVRIDARGIRREGAVLDRRIFDEVAEAVRAHS